jgi:hypothetical protein
MDNPEGDPAAPTDWRRQYAKKKYARLLTGLAVDLVGMSSYALPLLGESTDLVFGPLSGIACWLLYRKTLGGLGGVFGLLEELGPGTDIVPTLTLVWLYKYGVRGGRTYAEFVTEQKALKEADAA